METHTPTSWTKPTTVSTYCDKLLVFDLQGNPQPPIPLCMRVPKGKFRVDTEKSEVTLTTLPFEGWPAVVWTQDFKGKRKNFIAPGHLTVPRDFSNEVMITALC